MITAEQIRGARAMLRWSARKLAEMSGVSVPTIQRMESAVGVPRSISTNLDSIRRTLEDAGIAFIDDEGPGVRLRKIK
jgi:transcriptional regulator with XRE-family HTH domain